MEYLLDHYYNLEDDGINDLPDVRLLTDSQDIEAIAELCGFDPEEQAVTALFVEFDVSGADIERVFAYEDGTMMIPTNAEVRLIYAAGKGVA